MLPLLDLHGIKRLDFHNSVLEDLRERLVAQIANVASSGASAKERERRLAIHFYHICLVVPLLLP